MGTGTNNTDTDDVSDVSDIKDITTIQKTRDVIPGGGQTHGSEDRRRRRRLCDSKSSMSNQKRLISGLVLAPPLEEEDDPTAPRGIEPVHVNPWERPTRTATTATEEEEEDDADEEIYNNNIVRARAVDEEALEEEFHQRVVRNIATAEAVDEDELKAVAASSRGQMLYLLLPMILMGIALAIAVPMIKRKKEFLSSPTGPPTIPVYTDVEYLERLFLSISGEKVYEEDSPQYKAFTWLAYEDALELPIQETDEYTLVTRYALAVLYYSTGGESWINDLQFLSKEPVCGWNTTKLGVTICDESGMPLAIRFGEWTLYVVANTNDDPARLTICPPL